MGTIHPIPKTIAIDFGTTYSGYVYAEDEKSPLETHRTWKNNHGKLQERIPSTIVLKNCGGGQYKLEDFGLDAQKTYIEGLKNKNKDTEFQLFETIKLQILKSKLKDPTNALIKPIHGRSVQASTTFRCALEYMKNSLMENLKEEKKDWDPDEIYWILTVPAQYELMHRQLLINSAVQADLLDEQMANNYTLVSESEAAVYFCRNLNEDKFTDPRDASNHKEHKNFIVLDAGGGTVDITVVVEDTDTETEEHASNGGTWGGETITTNFKDRLREIKNIARFMDSITDSADQESWLQFLDNFETEKRKFSGEHPLLITIPVALSNAFKRQFGSTFSECFEAENDIRATRSGVEETLVVPPEIVKTKLFDEGIQRVKKMLERFLEPQCPNKFSIMYMVGGFSQNKYFQRELRAYAKGIRLLYPIDGCSSVMKGAVQYVHSRCTKKEHKTTATFAVGMPVNYDEKMHQGRSKLPGSNQILSLKTIIKVDKEVSRSLVKQKTTPYKTKNDETNPFVVEIFVHSKDKCEDPGEAEKLFTFECKGDETHIIHIVFTAKNIRVCVASESLGHTSIKRISHNAFNKKYVRSCNVM